MPRSKPGPCLNKFPRRCVPALKNIIPLSISPRCRLFIRRRFECARAVKITRKFIAGEVNAAALPATIVISMRGRPGIFFPRDVCRGARAISHGSTITYLTYQLSAVAPSHPKLVGGGFPRAANCSHAQAYRRSHNTVTAFAAGDNVIRAGALSA